MLINVTISTVWDANLMEEELVGGGGGGNS